MQKLILLVFCLFIVDAILAQTADSKLTDSTKHIVLTDVVINAKKSESGKYAKKVRSENVTIMIHPQLAEDGKETYWSTYCKPLNTLPVKLYGIELKLQPYDEKLFDMKLMILQVRASDDTLCRLIDIDADKIAKKQLVVDVKNENIILDPSNFYMGYAFIPKDMQTTYGYRVYANSKGDGAIISLKDGHLDIVKFDDFNYNFPFKISYITL